LVPRQTSKDHFFHEGHECFTQQNVKGEKQLAKIVDGTKELQCVLSSIFHLIVKMSEFFAHAPQFSSSLYHPLENTSNMSEFFASARYMVVKIVHSYSEVVL
jgi:hypothetical protein